MNKTLIENTKDYYVTPEGRVFRGNRELRKNKQNKGYVSATIRYLDGTRKLKLVHRLVAEAFIGPRPAGMDIDHVDGNRSNNHYTNLEYVTHSENLKRAWVRKLAKEKGE